MPDTYLRGSTGFGGHRLQEGVQIHTTDNGPTDGTSGTLAGIASKGALLIDLTNANIYINAGTLASPTWKLITRAA